MARLPDDRSSAKRMCPRRLGYTLEGALAAGSTTTTIGVYFPDRVIPTPRRAVTLEVFVDSHEYPRRTLNYFGIPKERLRPRSANAPARCCAIPAIDPSAAGHRSTRA